MNTSIIFPKVHPGARVGGPIEMSDLSHPPYLGPSQHPILCVPAQRTKKHFLIKLYWRDFPGINWLKTGKDESKIINVMASGAKVCQLWASDWPHLSPHEVDTQGPLRNLETELAHNAWGKLISLSTLGEAYDIVRENGSSQANMDSEAPVQTSQQGGEFEVVFGILSSLCHWDSTCPKDFSLSAPERHLDFEDPI